MKVTLESTGKIVDLDASLHRNPVRARVWQGETESGIPVMAFVTYISPELDKADARQAEFLAELEQQAAPRAAVEAIPLRLII